MFIPPAPMLDPRIYRTSLLAVVLAAIVLAFALQGQPVPLGTTLVPDAFDGQSAYTNMVNLACPYAHRQAGSSQAQALASAISARLRGDGFAVSSEQFTAATPAGARRHGVGAVARTTVAVVLTLIADFTSPRPTIAEALTSLPPFGSL